MKARITAIVIGVIALIVVLVALSGIRTVQTGEIGVVKTFGVAKNTLEPGLHFINPLISSLTKYDTKTREIKFDFQAYSKDAQTVTGQLAVQYRILSGDALKISQEYGTLEALEGKLQSVLPERAKSIFADKGAMELVESRSTLSTSIQDRIIPEVGKYYVTILMVALNDIAFNDAFETAVEQKMVSEQAKLRAEYEKDTAVIKGQQTLAVAELEAKANIAKSEGDAESLRIMQQAWSTLSAEVKDAMLRQTFYEKWDGILPTVMSGDSMQLIIGDNFVKQGAGAGTNANTYNNEGVAAP